MAESEPFSFEFVTNAPGHRLYDDYQRLTSAKVADTDIQISSALRAQFPEMIVTTIPTSNTDLLEYAAAGFAVAERDTKTDSVASWHGYFSPGTRGGTGSVFEAVFFAKYHYQWNREDFIVYTILVGYSRLQYVLKEPKDGETTSSTSSATVRLIAAVGAWVDSLTSQAILVYDGYWSLNRKLWEHVQDATWDKVILDNAMKEELTSVSEKFFDSQDVYEGLGVPWKRGIIFYGPAGNGKTISITALMHTLYGRKQPIPSLYVKNAPYTYNIRSVFQMARRMSPCLLVLEDIDTIVTSSNRSYFFNEVDGLEKNDGILMVASTNHLDRLDPGLSKRPSRFDRKYLFSLPEKDERTQYCQFWREKLKTGSLVEFPKKLCPAIAYITKGFSFAYIQEAFVATLLEIARNKTSQLGPSASGAKAKDGDDNGGGGGGDDDDDELDKYELWRVMKHQVDLLRIELGHAAAAAKGENKGEDKVKEEVHTPVSSAALGTSRAGPFGQDRGIPVHPFKSHQAAGPDLVHHVQNLALDVDKTMMLRGGYSSRGGCLDRPFY